MSNEIVVQNKYGLALAKFEIFRDGAEPVGAPSVQEHQDALDSFHAGEDMKPWVVGDILKSAATLHPQKYAQLFDASRKTGIPIESLRAFLWVSQAIPRVRRRTENVDWSLHREVAALEPKQQDKWLGLAEQHEMTMRQLRHSIKAGKVLTPEEIDQLSGKGSGIKGLFLENIIADFRKWRATEVGEDGSGIDTWSREKLGALVQELEEVDSLYLRAKQLLAASTVDI
jgi:hypothetical protein